VSGRSSKNGESDFFQFSLDEAAVDRLLSLKLETSPGNEFQLCLHDGRGKQLQCRTNTGGVELPGLVLASGDWGFKVARGSESAQYSVTLSGQGPIAPDFEAEPNDAIELASSVPSRNQIKGVFSGDDNDYYRFTVVDEPQLWRFQFLGDGIQEVAFYDGAATQTHRIRPPRGQRRVRLDNVFLLPGMHHVAVRGSDGGSYTMLARNLGPPDANGEREPNDDTSRMQRLDFGQTRTGLLEDKDDLDYYRFSLDDWDHIKLTITPPVDGSIFPFVNWYGDPLKNRAGAAVGEAIELSGLYPPGDYSIRLGANETSEAEYSIRLERLPRFSCPTDCEPNDHADLANPLPSTLVIDGRAGRDWRDEDVYELPVFDTATQLRLTASRGVIVAEERNAPNLVTLDRATGMYTGTIPAGRRTYIFVTTNGPIPEYHLALLFGDGPAPNGAARESELSLTLTLDAAEVAAYREYGQLVRGNLRITNGGNGTSTVNLETATSNYRWRLGLDQREVSIPAGGTVVVPALVHVPEDAFADKPVRLSVGAFDTAGVQAETFVEISAGRETPPIEPVRGWTLPDELVGGFNAAQAALGGRWTGEYVNSIGVGFPVLFDGMAVDDQFLQLRNWKEPETRDVTVDLAGDAPVEVVGVAVNLMGGQSAVYWLRNLDFSVSMDGETFTPILSGTLKPIKTEQAFVLDSPVQARFARLTFRDTFNGSPRSQLNLGEFKVIVRPGTDISNDVGFNLADPELGGHVVWAKPDAATRIMNRLLTEDGDNRSTRVPSGERFEWVVGFHHDRAAQLRRIEWIDAPTEANRIRNVTVSTSLDSPLGPWTTLEEWQLDGDSDSHVLAFEQPVWARFLKFSSAPVEALRSLATPATLRVWERPTGGEYRSILAEWGEASQAAIYEALHEVEIEKPFVPAANDASMASMEKESRAGVVTDPATAPGVGGWGEGKAKTLIVILVVVVSLDVITKLLIQANFHLYDTLDIVGSYVRLTYIHNPGAAFGIHLGPYSRVIFLALSLVALVALGGMYWYTPANDRVRLASIALICAGAVGNLLDRIKSASGVVDFLDVGVGNVRWPVFNVADIAVTTGAIVLALSLWKEEKRVEGGG
jgi:signal peptidase II